MPVSPRTHDVIEPVVSELGLDLFDLDHEGGRLIVTLDKEGGIDMGEVASATRAISRALDEHDPIAGSYTLEVSSPGLERPLRTPAHFRWAIGRTVSIKTVPEHEGPRRVSGTITAADDDQVTLTLDEAADESCTLAFAEIDKARTTFAWGPGSKPGSPGGKGRAGARPKTTSKQKRVNAP